MKKSNWREHKNKKYFWPVFNINCIMNIYTNKCYPLTN